MVGLFAAEILSGVLMFVCCLLDLCLFAGCAAVQGFA